jgi:hypothetical protein
LAGEAGAEAFGLGAVDGRFGAADDAGRLRGGDDAVVGEALQDDFELVRVPDAFVGGFMADLVVAGGQDGALADGEARLEFDGEELPPLFGLAFAVLEVQVGVGEDFEGAVWRSPRISPVEGWMTMSVMAWFFRAGGFGVRAIRRFGGLGRCRGF